MLGTRERSLYGNLTLEEIQKTVEKAFADEGHSFEWFQSNSESKLVEKIHSLAKTPVDGMVINPGAYSHTSVAILDALKIISFPIAEVHLTNTHRRESFRLNRPTASAATVVIEGAGQDSYILGIKALSLKGSKI